MRNLLLTLCMGAAALTAQAEVTTFYMEGTPLCRYHGKADQMVEIPHGFVFTYQAYDALCRSEKVLDKAMVSNAVYIESDRLRKADRTFLPETTTPYSYTRCGQLMWYAKNVVKVTPAAGTAVTKIVVHTVKPNNNALKVVAVENDALAVKSIFTNNSADSTQTWTGNISEPFHILNVFDNLATNTAVNPMWIEVTTEGTSTQVAVPVVKKALPILGKSEKVELTCPTEGAKIYYTVNYENKTEMPTTASTLYTGPFTLEKDAVVRAIAVKDGMTNSFPIYQEYYVVDDYAFMAEFNFNDHTTLKDMDGKQIAGFAKFPVVNPEAPGASSTEKVSIANAPIFDKDVMFSSEKASITLSNSFSGVVELRPDKAVNVEFGVTAPADYYISSMLLITGYTANGLSMTDDTPGTFEVSPINAARKIYRNTDKEGYFATYKVIKDKNSKNAVDQQYIDHLYVFLKSVDGSGIDGIEADVTDENAPVEYFNLQGVRVANPKDGIFIKRQGNKATKVYVK